MTEGDVQVLVAAIMAEACAECGCSIPSPFDEVAQHAVALALELRFGSGEPN